VRLALEAYGVDAGPGSASFPSTPPPAQRTQLGARDVLDAVVHRDMATLTALRAELFPPPTQPAFAKTSADLAPLLGGLDLYEDILPHTSPWLRFVARAVEFEPGVAPSIALPAVCVVARITDETVAQGLVSAFQTTIGLVNLQASKQRRPALRLDLALIDGVTMTRARYPRPRTVDAAGAPMPVDVRYNLAPACALVGEHFVLGTHHALVTEIARELAGQAEAPRVDPEGGHDTDHIVLRGAPLAASLRANRETLTLGAMLNDGQTRARAEAELEAVAALLAACDRIELSAGAPAAQRLSLELSVRFE
jgi:hypothetical protein